MDLLAYRTVLRGLLVDTDYDQLLIDQALNWAVYELCNNNHLRIMEASETVTASRGDTTLSFPDDMMTLIKEGFYGTSPQVIEMGHNFVEYGNFMRNYANFATANQQRVGAWTDFNNQARFSAPLNIDHTFQVDYLRVPNAMEDDGDECEIPDNYSELVSKMGLARIMEINEDYAEAQQERQNFAPLMTTFIRNESRGGMKTGGTVIRQGRSRNPYRADKDF